MASPLNYVSFLDFAVTAQRSNDFYFKSGKRSIYLNQIQRRKRLSWSFVETRKVFDNIRSQRLWESSHWNTNKSLAQLATNKNNERSRYMEELDNRCREGKCASLFSNIIFTQSILDHELRQVPHNFRTRGDFDNITQKLVRLHYR